VRSARVSLAFTHPHAEHVCILPLEVETPVWRWMHFTAFLERADDSENLVHIETLTAGLTVRNPTDVARHMEAFDRLSRAAAAGDAARALLQRVAAELR